MSAVPVPIADLWEWQQEGLCRTGNPEMFFHPEGERGPSRRRRAERAVAICQECPVLQRCRNHALRHREPYGVWGGMTEEERQAVLARGDYTGEELPDAELAG
jgi:WhiB family redox-sensing transcriptional regulator